MPIAAALGRTLVPLDELDAVADTKAIRDFVDEEEVDSKFSAPITEDVTIRARDLAKAREVRSTAHPYEGIGLGKPLTIVIESIYIGDYPDTMPLVPWVDRGDVLVTSAHKAFESFDAAPRAVHLLQANAKPRTAMRAKATETGSQLVYYSPGVTGLSILFSVELSVDRELNNEIGEALGKAVTAAGALPVFAPAAPFLVAAGTAIPIASKAVSMLARPQTFFGEHVELNFDRPGVELAQPGALVLFGGNDPGVFGTTYKLGKDFKMRVDGTGRQYDGPAPYVVISLDGTERDELDGWSAAAASAVLLERFFHPDELITKALEVVTDSITLYNDMTYRQKAAKALKKSKRLRGPKKKRQEDLYNAYLKNIQTKEIRDALESES
jgi:hypothetical protein